MVPHETWFDNGKNRQKLYLFLAAIGTALISVGLATEELVGLILESAGWLLSAIAAILMIARMNWDQRLSWFSSGGRAAIYGGGVTLLGFGLGFGWISEDQVSMWTVYLGQALNVFAAGLAMLSIQEDLIGAVTPGEALASTIDQQGTLFPEED